MAVGPGPGRWCGQSPPLRWVFSLLQLPACVPAAAGDRVHAHRCPLPFHLVPFHPGEGLPLPWSSSQDPPLLLPAGGWGGLGPGSSLVTDSVFSIQCRRFCLDSGRAARGPHSVCPPRWGRCGGFSRLQLCHQRPLGLEGDCGCWREGKEVISVIS